MEKAYADEMKAEFVSSEKEASNKKSALEFMSEEELEDALEILQRFGDWLEEYISDYALDCSHTLIDEESEDIVRTYWFSKGMEDTFVVLNASFQIRGFDPDIPLPLLAQVAEGLDELKTKVLEIIADEGESELKKWRTDGREGFQKD